MAEKKQPARKKVRKSAAKFRSEVKTKVTTYAMPEPCTELAVILTDAVSEASDDTFPCRPEMPLSRDEAEEVGVLPKQDPFATATNVQVESGTSEGEQRSDPTLLGSVPEVQCVPTATRTQQPTPAVQESAISVRDAITSIVQPSSNGLASTGMSLGTNLLTQGIGHLKPGTVGVIGDTVAGMTPTDEQRAILEIVMEAMNGKAQAVCIKAGAGTGKTATLKMVEQVLTGKGVYTAFNRSLVEESKGKFKMDCRTTHSLAFQAVGKQYAHRLGGNRVKSWEVARILGIEDMTVTVDVTKDAVTGAEKPHLKVLKASYLAGQCSVAIRQFCQSDDREIGTKHFKHIQGIDLTGRANNELARQYLLPFARKMWADLSAVDGKLPFNHDAYVKVWALGTGTDKPVIQADYILLDEAQDTAPVLVGILRQQRHALLVLVGDENQIIYEWRGACDAMAEFPDAPSGMLSQSFRFGQAIADVANSILRRLEVPTELVMKGLESIPSRVCHVEQPKCVLCRTNAAAVSTVLGYLEQGNRPHLIGGGADVVAFCKAAIDLQAKRKTAHPELCCFESWQEVQEYAGTDEGEELKLMVKLIDEFGAQEIVTALEQMPSEKDADVVVCTAHKSKGRQWTSVKLAGDFPPANRMSDSDVRLLYVAATRAQHQLDVTDCPPFLPCTDRQTGKSYPGIEVRFTKPMPTAEQLDAFLSASWVTKQEQHGSSCITRSERPLTAMQEVRQPEFNGPAPTGFSWTKWNDSWCVRGPVGHEGKNVTVNRKAGSSSVERLGKLLWTDGSVAVYGK